MRLNLGDMAHIMGVPDVFTGIFAKDAGRVPSGASSDNRTVRPGHVFFCLPGERADGHDFAAAAVEAGAIAVVGTRDPFAGKSPVPLCIVPDVTAALGKLGRAHREYMRGTVVGITGSAGKTSVKEALASVLSLAGKTEKNPLNLNTQIGLPLSMLNASEEAAFWVMEAGISQPRDMDELGAILHPDCVLLLNAGDGHTEFLGDKGVAHYKAKLLDYLPAGGKALVCADYPELLAEARLRKIPLVTFTGRGEDAAYVASPAPGAADALSGRGLFTVRWAGGELTADSPFQGAIGAENTAAVTAAALSLGLSPERVARGLAQAEPPVMRARISPCGTFVLMDDSYNANPLSMNRMLDNAAALAREKGLPLILVLGEMRELGEIADARHEELGAHAGALDPALLFWKGGRFDAVSRGLARAGRADAAIPASDPAAFVEAVRASALTKGVVLFKASRSIGIDTLAGAFRAAFEPECSEEPGAR